MEPDHLTHHAATIGDRPALVEDRPDAGVRTLTYAELDLEVNRLANGLVALGVAPGERVSWCGPNSIEAMLAFHAARRIGAVAVPLPYRLTAAEAAHVLDNSDAVVALVDAEHADLVDESRHRALRRVAVFGGAPGPGRLAWPDLLGGPEAPPDELRTASTRLMIYTSGTTGLPKGAVRQIGGAANQFGALLELLGWHEHAVVFLTTGPLYHSGPSGFALRAMLVGGTVVLQRHFDPVDWLRLVDSHRVTATFAAPTPMRRVVGLPAEVKARYDVSSLRCMIANAAPWTMALKEAYVRDFPPESLWEVYGSTELSVCTVLEPGDHFRKPGSCGRAAPGVEIRLYDEAGRQITEPDVPGELFVRSAGVFETYHKNAERYAADRRDGFQTVGDIASVDAEGYYSIRDRKSDMILSGGVNVYPAEIENVLDAHPDVDEVAVVGVPDPEWGEAVAAFVVPAPGGALATADPAEREAAIGALLAWARERLAGYKVPKSVELITELPKTGTGKVRKRDLRP